MEISEFLQPITEERLRKTYQIDTSKVGPRLEKLRNESTKLLPLLQTNSADGNRLIYVISFYTVDAEPVLDKDLERWLCDHKKLLADPSRRSKVAVRVNFFIRSRFQQQGLAHYVLQSEEETFRSWGAREIQVYAMYDGRWVWTRPQFGYRLTMFEFESLQQQYRDWQRSKGAAQIIRAGNSSDFPRDFLLSEVSSLRMYKSL